MKLLLRFREIALAASSHKLIRKGQRRIDGMDQKILSMYARGMTVREIQGHLKELYATEISADLISSAQ